MTPNFTIRSLQFLTVVVQHRRLDHGIFIEVWPELAPRSKMMALTPKSSIPVLQKHRKLERMRGCNCSFIIEKEPFIEWITAAEIANQLNNFEERSDCKFLFQRNPVPLKILDHSIWHSEIMTAPLKCTSTSFHLK